LEDEKNVNNGKRSPGHT